FAGRLLGPELALAGDVAAVALGRHVFLDRGDGFPSDHPAADGGLDGNFKQVPVDLAAQLLDQVAATALGVGAVDDRGQGVHALAGDQDVQPHQVGGPVADEVVIHRAVAVRYRL